MDEVKVMQVIFCSKKRRGEGKELSPIRVIEEIFDFDGNLISENDPDRIFSSFDMVSFALMIKGISMEDVNFEKELNKYKKTRNQNQ